MDNWGAAPIWAQWFAVNQDHMAQWHECKPKFNHISGDWYSAKRTKFAGFCRKVKCAQRPQGR